MKNFFKYIYHVFPFKKTIFTGLKLFWIPPKNITQHLHFNSTIKINVSSDKSFYIRHYGYIIENELFWHGLDGAWEKISFKLWKELSKGATTIIDIGANTGVYALISKTINPASRVFAMEPVKRVFDKLEVNIALNKYDVICIPDAASNKDGEAIIYDVPDLEHIYSVTVNKNMYTSDTLVVQTAINTIKLDTLIEKYNIDKIDLLKIDVETHEPEVIEGYLKYIHLHKPSILIEILNDEVGKKVEDMIASLGYLYFNIDENSGVKRVEKITKSDYYNYLLCDYDKAVDLNLI